MKNVLITGGTGYLGDRIVTESLPDINFTGFDQGSPITFGHLGDKMHFIQGDIRDALAVKKAIFYTDVVVHLAFLVGGPACKKDPRYNYQASNRGPPGHP